MLQLLKKVSLSRTLCCTGLKITDFNTVDSFYTMVEKISEKYEGDDSVEN